MYLKKKMDLYYSTNYGLLFLLIGLILLSGGMYVSFDPPTYTVNEQTGEEIYTFETTHQSTTVQNNSSLYNQNDVLTDEFVYFQQLHPELQINPQTSESINETTITDTSITLVATSSRTGELWNRSYTPENNLWISQDGSTVTVSIPELIEFKEELRDEFPSATTINLQIEYNGVISSEQEEMDFSNSTVVEFPNNTIYTVESTSFEETVSIQEQVTYIQEDRSISIQSYNFGIFGLVIGIVGLIIILIGSYLIYGNKYGDRSYEKRLFDFHKYKYDSWISTGRPYKDPEFDQNWEQIKVDTLEDLVELAIDSGERIISSEEMGKYYVFDSGTLYIYTEPSAPNKETRGQSFPAFDANF